MKFINAARSGDPFIPLFLSLGQEIWIGERRHSVGLVKQSVVCQECCPNILAGGELALYVDQFRFEREVLSKAAALFDELQSAFPRVVGNDISESRRLMKKRPVALSQGRKFAQGRCVEIDDFR